MAEPSGLNTINRVASVDSVEKAVSLLKLRAQKTGKRKRSEPIKDKVIYSQCLPNFTSFQKKSTASQAFSPGHVVVEMRNALIHEDWASIQKMFPILLKNQYSSNITWRYAFLLYLLCPYADLTSFQEFFKMTVSAKLVNNEFYLEKLMSLQTVVQPNDS